MDVAEPRIIGVTVPDTPPPHGSVLERHPPDACNGCRLSERCSCVVKGRARCGQDRDWRRERQRRGRTRHLSRPPRPITGGRPDPRRQAYALVQPGRSWASVRNDTGGPSTSRSKKPWRAAPGDDSARRTSSRLLGPRRAGRSPGRGPLAGRSWAAGVRPSRGTSVRTSSRAGSRTAGGGGTRSRGGGERRTSGEACDRPLMTLGGRPCEWTTCGRPRGLLFAFTSRGRRRWRTASRCRPGRSACGRGP